MHLYITNEEKNSSINCMTLKTSIKKLSALKQTIKQVRINFMHLINITSFLIT